MKRSEERSITIQVLERAFGLLDLLASHQEPVSLKAISEQSGLHPSTAHRILNDLTIGRYVDRPGARQLSPRHAAARARQPGQGAARRSRRGAGADARAAQADAPAGQPVDAPRRRDRLRRAHLQRALGHAGRSRRRRPCAAAPDVGRQAVPRPRRRASASAPTRRAPAWPATRATASPSCRGSSASWRACSQYGTARDDEELELGVRCMAAGHPRRPGQAGRRAVDLGAGRSARGEPGSSGCARRRRRSRRALGHRG